jgi:hypothetical protein
MTEVTYNGWANYSTWRIRLELFDGWDVSAGPVTAEEIKCIAEDQIEFSSEEGPARDYAMAFISDVDWREIAESINQKQIARKLSAGPVPPKYQGMTAGQVFAATTFKS